jgi:hypothetical protein
MSTFVVLKTQNDGNVGSSWGFSFAAVSICRRCGSYNFNNGSWAAGGRCDSELDVQHGYCSVKVKPTSKHGNGWSGTTRSALGTLAYSPGCTGPGSACNQMTEGISDHHARPAFVTMLDSDGSAKG